MESLKVYLVADAMITALGSNTVQTLAAMDAYRSGVALHTDGRVSQEPIQAALIPEEVFGALSRKYGGEYTRPELLAVAVIDEVVQKTALNTQGDRCALILSTTKGNIACLRTETGMTDERVFLHEMARRIAYRFDMERRVQVVSNACISGVSALIVAKRWIEQGRYDDVIVVGCDVLSHFITSGFRSFRSLSMERCRPYDAARDGLNLGEACGAIVLSRQGHPDAVVLAGGAISNDANHISGPSRTGDGLFFAMRHALQEAGVTREEVGFVDLHGTSTIYNDEMESKAVALAELSEVPVQSLKPYFGHTLGASGVIETIVCMHQLRRGRLWATLGFEELGVPQPLKVYAAHRDFSMRHCVKTASGFGGCNAAIVLSMPAYALASRVEAPAEVVTIRTVEIADNQVKVDGECRLELPQAELGLFLREAFKQHAGNGLKFHKMDNLCKLGFLASAYLLEDVSFAPEEMAVLLANASASLDTDLRHEALIEEGGDAGASPAVFVYTLPNVVAGEVCIAHKIQGENTFFITSQYQRDELQSYARIVMAKNRLRYAIIGWCEWLGTAYRATFELLKQTEYGRID